MNTLKTIFDVFHLREELEKFLGLHLYPDILSLVSIIKV